MKIKNFSEATFSNGVNSCYTNITLPTIAENIKITKAKLKLKTTNVNLSSNEGVTVNYKIPGVENAGWSNVDFINNINNNTYIYLDITDELNDAYLKKYQTIKLEFAYANSDTISFENLTNENFDVEYIALDEFKSNGSNHKIDLEKAGKCSVDIATGILSLTHIDTTSDSNVLPLSIAHNYNSSKKNQLIFKDSELKSHCGNGWNLNVQQYLRKINNEADNGTLKFQYLNGDGKIQNIEEKYYYINNNKKHFVNRTNLDVDLDGNLVLTEAYAKENNLNITQTEILTTLESQNGLKLNSSIEDFPTAKLVDYIPEEIANLKNAIEKYDENLKSIDKNIISNQWQLYLLAISKKLADSTKDSTKETLPEIDFSDASEIFNYVNDIANLSDDIFQEINNPTEYLSIELINSLNNELQVRTDKDGENNKIVINSTEKDIYSLIVQINNTKRSIDDLIKQKEELNEYLRKYRHQLESYELQLPVHYLYDDNLIYGFAKASKEDENLFRLVLITDSYGNAIQINYKDFDNNKIVSITDSAEKTILFDYDDNDLLTSITDSRDRKIKFEYNENNLSKITYHNGQSSQYFYDNENQLTGVIDQTGLGSIFTYQNGQVVKTQALSLLNSVKHNQHQLKTSNYNDLALYQIEDQFVTFNYYDYKTTYVTNAKGKKVVYVFNEIGQVINIYEETKSLISGEDATQIKEFSYLSNRLTETVSILPYSTDYLEDSGFDNALPSYEPALFLGQAVCGANNYNAPYSQQVENCIKHKFSGNAQYAQINMSEFYVNKLNSSNVKNLVLAGWAKANSAFVYNPDTIEKFSEEAIDYPNYIINRKFELRIEVKYVNESLTQTFSKQFNWMNTQWQYCALPIKLKPDSEIESITCYFDYSNNTNREDVEFSNLQLREGTYENKQYDDEGHLIKSENHTTYTEYEYDTDNNLTKETTHTVHNPDKAYTTTYEYNKNKKLLKTIDYNNIVTENVYDDKGVCVKTMTYNQDDPTSKYYSESVIDEKGNTSADVNDLGETVTNYKYIEGTGIVATETDQDKNQIAYGYDSDDTLISMSSSVNNEENTNIYGYTLSFLTSLQHNGFAYNYEYDEQGRLNKINVADNEYLSKSYTDNSETTTYQNGATYTHNFNSDGNVINVKYNDEQIVENIYDTLGSLIRTTDNSNAVEEVHKYFYDKYRTQYKEESLQHGNQLNIENTIDENTNQTLSSQITLNEQQLTYQYSYNDDLDAKLNQITLPNGNVQNIAYDKLGRLSEIKQGQFTKLFNYLKSGDHVSNLVSSIWYGKDNAINENLTYKYDSKGNIIEVQENGKMICHYAYDGLSRLIREDNKHLQKTVTYSYDAGGNILMRTEYAFTLKPTAELDNGISYSYNYPVSGWRDQLQSYNGESFVHDALGNPTTYRGKTLQWSHGRQLDQFADIASYTYNANGIRIAKTINGTITKFYLNGNQIVCQDNGNKLFFHYGVDGITGFTLQLSETISREFTYKKNLQGDIIGIYDQDNTLFCKYVYDAWGNHKTFVLVGSDYVELTENIESTLASIARLNPFRYRGYYYDIETGLYYLNSRYYDPELGRFINADDISVLNESKNIINGLNLYFYCGDNPIINTDISGRAWWHWIIGAAVIATAVVLTVVTAGGFAAAGAAVAGAVGASTAATGAAGVLASVAVGAVVSSAVGAASGMLISGITTNDWSINNLLDGASKGFMWGAIGGAIGGGIGTIGCGQLIQGITQGITQAGVYTAKTLTRDEKFTISGFINAGFAGFAGGSMYNARFNEQLTISILLATLDNSIASLKKGLNNTFIERFVNSLFGKKIWNTIW